MVANELKTITGKRPHVVYNLVHPSRLDVDSKKDEATFGVTEAENAYDAYVGFIQQAKNTFAGAGILFDIHGQTHTLTDGSEWMELGYLISTTQLNDEVFGASDSSIKKLGLTASDFASLVQGSQSFGGFLQAEGFKCVPSTSHPSPGSESYYSGGHTVKTYGSQVSGAIDAIQVSLSGSQRSDSTSRVAVSKGLATAIKNFMDARYPGWN